MSRSNQVARATWSYPLSTHVSPDSKKPLPPSPLSFPLPLPPLLPPSLPVLLTDISHRSRPALLPPQDPLPPRTLHNLSSSSEHLGDAVYFPPDFCYPHHVLVGYLVPCSFRPLFPRGVSAPPMPVPTHGLPHPSWSQSPPLPFTAVINMTTQSGLCREVHLA